MIHAWFRPSVLSLLLVAALAAQEPKPPLLTPDEQKLAAEANKLNEEGVTLYQRGQPAAAIGKFQQVLETRRRLYTEAKYPAGHPDLANSLSNLGVVFQAAGNSIQAQSYFEQALAMRRALFPKEKFPAGHLDLANSLNNLGALLMVKGDYDQSRAYMEQALTMRRELFPKKLFPTGHPHVADSLYNLGILQGSAGNYEQARLHSEEALAIYQGLFPKEKYPAGHPHLASSLNSLGNLLRDAGDYQRSRTYYDQALAMRRRLFPKETYPAGHPDIGFNLNDLGRLLQEAGDYEKARGFFEQALAMRRELYPKDKYPAGHPQIAASLNGLGNLFQIAGNYDQALLHFEEAMAILRRLYPKAKYPAGHPDLAAAFITLGQVMKEMRNLEQARHYTGEGLAMLESLFPQQQFPAGHPHLARALTTVGVVLEVSGEYEQARQHFEKALEMNRRRFPEVKYPTGHQDLAINLNNLGGLHWQAGNYDEALAHLEKGLAMSRELYPEKKYPAGHPYLAASLITLGSFLQATGNDEQARTHLEQGLSMQRALADQYTASASETESLAFVESQSHARDIYLSVTARLANTDADTFRAVWQTQASVSRVLERRHANARAAGTEHAADLERLAAIRRRIAQLLPEARLSPAERDKLLAGLAHDQEELERKLATAIPALKRWKERDVLGPKDLVTSLPTKTAFIELLRYIRVEHDPKIKGFKSEKLTDSYLAFVLVPGEPIRRIELGEAEPIDEAVRAWRESIERRGNKFAPQALVALWGKIDKLLPTATRTLYLALDGDLARVPFCALPGKSKDTVLLDDFEGGIAIVPHGPFLLEQIRFPLKVSGADSLLAVGGVDYGSTKWPALPGTQRELDALYLIGPRERETLRTKDATPSRIADKLPKVRYAHLATHGFFNAADLILEKTRQRAAMKNWQFGESGPRKVASKNPLGFVGLVLSGGEVMTGLSLVDLPLENLRLVTLSACETGLGEHTGGEGVQGLQRAFHLAGCPNVVASLWKVDDAATAALMAKFYHELWTNKKPPIEALREAQLLVFRHPELIPELAGERGTEQIKKTVVAKPFEPGAKRTDTKLWAAFVLSGAGK